MMVKSRSAALLSRLNRRLLVLTCYAGYLLMTLAWTLLEQPWRWFAVIPLGMVSILAMGLLMMPALLGVSDGADNLLDERQMQLRNEGYVWAYRLLGTAVILSALYLMMASGSSWWLPRTELALQAVFWGVWGLAITLPTAVIAWREPDSSKEE